MGPAHPIGLLSRFVELAQERIARRKQPVRLGLIPHPAQCRDNILVAAEIELRIAEVPKVPIRVARVEADGSLQQRDRALWPYAAYRFGLASVVLAKLGRK